MRDITEEHHFHGCRECGHIWDHEPQPIGGSKEDFDKMHACEACGSQRNCDIACSSHTEAQELVTHGFITENGKRYYACLDDALRYGGKHA